MPMSDMNGLGDWGRWSLWTNGYWVAFAVILLVLFGLLGYSMQKLDIPIPPMVLGLILGSTLEKNFRMAMVEKSGSLSVFLDKPIALFFIALAILSLIYSVWQTLKASAREAEKVAEEGKTA